MSKSTLIIERIAALEAFFNKSGNQLGLDADVGNGTVGGWTDSLIGKPSLAVKQFLRHYNINPEWWKTGKGDIFITPVQNPSDIKGNPLADDPAVFVKALAELEKIGYRALPATILEGEYRIELQSELEERRKDRAENIELYKKLIKKLEDEIAVLRAGKPITSQSTE